MASHSSWNIFQKFFPIKQNANSPLADNHLDKNEALEILEANGLSAHYYLPAVQIKNSKLAKACRLLGHSGYIITDSGGNFIGNLLSVPSSNDEIKQENQASFRIVELRQKVK